MKAGISSHIHA
jgi:hypothetical protein